MHSFRGCVASRAFAIRDLLGTFTIQTTWQPSSLKYVHLHYDRTLKLELIICMVTEGDGESERSPASAVSARGLRKAASAGMARATLESSHGCTTSDTYGS